MKGKTINKIIIFSLIPYLLLLYFCFSIDSAKNEQPRTVKAASGVFAATAIR